MYSCQKRTVKEFNEGLYRKPLLTNLSNQKQDNPYLFTFNKMPPPIPDYTKSSLARWDQENINTSNRKDGWFNDKYKGFEFTFNGYLSKKKAIQLDNNFSLQKSEGNMAEEQQVNNYLVGTFIGNKGVLVRSSEYQLQFQSDHQEDHYIGVCQSQSIAQIKSYEDRENYNYFQSEDEEDVAQSKVASKNNNFQKASCSSDKFRRQICRTIKRYND